MLRDMKSKSKDGKIAIGQTAVAIYDAAGNARGFSDILADVEKATVGMTGAQKDAALAAIFGDEAMRGVNIALGEGSDKLKELEKDFKNSEGAAARMGEVMNDNLGGDLKGLASAWEGFKIALFDEGLGDFARPIIQGITGVIQTFPKGISKAGEFFSFIKSKPKEGAEALTEMGKNIEKFGGALPILEKLRDGFSKIREKAVEMKDKVNGALTEMRSYIEGKMIELGPVFERLGTVFREYGQLVMEVFTKLWGFVGPILNILGTALRILGDVVMTIFAAVIVPAIELMWVAMQSAWTVISPILDGMKLGLETAGQAMTWLWENAGQPLVTFLGGALKLGIDTAKAAVEAFSGAFEWLSDKISAVTDVFSSMKDGLMSFKPPEWVGNLGSKISGAVSGVSNFITGSHATGLEKVPYDG